MKNENKSILDNEAVATVVKGFGEGLAAPGISFKSILIFSAGFTLWIIIGVGVEMFSYYKRFPSDMWLRFFIEDATPSGRARQYQEKLKIDRERTSRPQSPKEA